MTRVSVFVVDTSDRMPESLDYEGSGFFLYVEYGCGSCGNIWGDGEGFEEKDLELELEFRSSILTIKGCDK